MQDDFDKSGIFSLGGFAYQIRILAYYSSKLAPNEQIEFETIDDVAINKNNIHLSLDQNSTAFSSLIGHGSLYDSIQVKRTKITNSIRAKVLFNWLLTEIFHGKQIEKYILVTESEDFSIKDVFFLSEKKIYELIIQSDKKANALVSKVKKLVENDFSKFEVIYKSVKSKYSYLKIQGIDETILDSFKVVFRFTAIKESTYKLRVREYINQITYEIIESILNKKPYCLSYSSFEKMVENKCSQIQDEKVELDYSVFKKVNTKDINISEITISREYRQLVACGLNEKSIETYLMCNEYYKESRLSSMSNNRASAVRNIEETAYENFEIVKEDLQLSDRDSPYKRMHETTEKENSYANNNQVRIGSCIYLTNESTPLDYLITWDESL